jgi:hypothetical protein
VLISGAAVAAPAGVTWSTANSVATGDQDNAAIAMNRNGYVAVVWEDDRDTTNAADNTHSEIFIRLYHDGTSVYEKQLSAAGTSGVSWKHISPDVGLDDKGDAVVVWSDDPDGNGFFNVPYRVLSPTGAVLGSGQANAGSAGQQIWPKVAVDPDGTPATPSAVAFTVVWEDVQGTNPATVKASGYTNGAAKAYEVTASQTTGSHHRPDVAVSASGDALVVWNEDSDANGFDNIGLVRLARANGAVNLSRRTANSLGDGQQRNAAIAANYNGDFTVAWESDHTGTRGIWERSFTSAGTPRHVEVPVSTEANASAPTAGLDDQANLVVGWTTPANGLDVWARGFNPDGTTDGRIAAQAYSDVTAGRQEGIGVAVSPWGEVSVSFTDDTDGNTFDQVRLGLGAVNSTFMLRGSYRARATLTVPKS